MHFLGCWAVQIVDTFCMGLFCCKNPLYLELFLRKLITHFVLDLFQVSDLSRVLIACFKVFDSISSPTAV